MKWEEDRKIYPDRFVKIQILKAHIKDSVRYIDDMAVIQSFDDKREATRELVRAKGHPSLSHWKRKAGMHIRPII